MNSDKVIQALENTGYTVTVQNQYGTDLTKGNVRVSVPPMKSGNYGCYLSAHGYEDYIEYNTMHEDVIGSISKRLERFRDGMMNERDIRNGKHIRKVAKHNRKIGELWTSYNDLGEHINE